MLKRIFKAWLGDFQKGELLKFGLLSVMFFFVIGTYWLLRPLKDSIFMSVVGKEYIPMAKWLSMLLVLPLVMIYSKLIDLYPRHRMFYALGTIYVIITLVFAFLMWHPSTGLLNKVESPYRFWGWAWYVFVESFGSLIVALFWAFAADTTKSESAADGFRLVSFGGQLGNIFGPAAILYILNFLKISGADDGVVTPEMAHYEMYGIVGCVLLAAVTMICLIGFVKVFMQVVPEDQLKGFEAKNEAAVEKEHEKEPGFFEGLKLLFSSPYLLGIFALITFFEVIITVFDFNLKFLVGSAFTSSGARSEYLATYGMYTGLVSFFCVFLGVNRIQKLIGVGASLMLLPILVAVAAFLFQTHPIINVLFWIMVISKAFNYALAQPTMKQLYIPTSKDAKYKSQAFIEMYGSRGSKALGSAINNYRRIFVNQFGEAAGVAKYMALTAYASIGIIGVWLVLALYMGRAYTKAVEQKRLIV